MKKTISRVSVVTASLAASLFAQEERSATPADGAVVSVGVCRRIQSAVLNEERAVSIRVPDDYGKGNKRYPVLYKLDGDKSMFLQTVGSVEYLADWRQAPDYIVVGIENTDRNRDVSPELGADRFVLFLAEELVPFIEANFRTSESRILCGQSASSGLALYASLRRRSCSMAMCSAASDCPRRGSVGSRRSWAGAQRTREDTTGSMSGMPARIPTTRTAPAQVAVWPSWILSRRSMARL